MMEFFSYFLCFILCAIIFFSPLKKSYFTIFKNILTLNYFVYQVAFQLIR